MTVLLCVLNNYKCDLKCELLSVCRSSIRAAETKSISTAHYHSIESSLVSTLQRQCSKCLCAKWSCFIQTLETTHKTTHSTNCTPNSGCSLSLHLPTPQAKAKLRYPEISMPQRNNPYGAHPQNQPQTLWVGVLAFRDSKFWLGNVIQPINFS